MSLNASIPVPAQPNHDWRTRGISIEDGIVEESQECSCHGLRRTLTRKDHELAAFIGIREAA